MQKTDSALWWGLGSLILAAIVYFALRDTASDAGRVVLTLLAVAAPLPLLLWQADDPAQWLGSLPEPLVILISAGVGLALWGISWWLMSLSNDPLTEAVGTYNPNFTYLKSWAVEVLYFALLLPACTSLLVFGVMRSRLQSLPRPLSICLLGLYVGILGMLTTPQGLVGVLGYGLLGLVAAFLSLQVGSFWAGFAAYSAFMYANLAFLDNLGRELAGVSYIDTRWLTLVLVSAFFSVILIQVLRFRTTSDSPTSSANLSRMGWSALLGVVVVLMLYSANELQQRNQAGSAAPSNMFILDN